MAGWYDDPEDTDQQRYWDGDVWTEKRRPAPAFRLPPPDMHGAAARAKAKKADPASGVVVAGYICAVLFPLLGFVLGLTQINRSKHGLNIVLLSVVLGYIYVKMALG
jgi:uncharacterized membrane protein